MWTSVHSWAGVRMWDGVIHSTGSVLAGLALGVPCGPAPHSLQQAPVAPEDGTPCLTEVVRRSSGQCLGLW